LATAVPWAPAALKFHAKRWEYLHGRMHAAGYALDPEYLYTGDGGALDASTMEGLMEIVELMSLRHIIMSAQDPASAALQLTLNCQQVPFSTLAPPACPLLHTYPPNLFARRCSNMRVYACSSSRGIQAATWHLYENIRHRKCESVGPELLVENLWVAPP